MSFRIILCDIIITIFITMINFILYRLYYHLTYCTDAFQHSNKQSNHRNNNNKIASITISDIGDIFQNYFSAMTTTSPNSILLASIDASRSQFSVNGVNWMTEAMLNTKEFRSNMRKYGMNE